MNLDSKRQEILKQAIHTYGKTMQMAVAVEELSELTKEIIKNFRRASNTTQIAEEIADVEIMMEQLKIIFHCEPVTRLFHRQKVKRLKDRLLENTK